MQRLQATLLGDTRGSLSIGALDQLGGVVVGGSIAEAATTVALLSDNGTSALAGVEATAARCAIGVAGASTGDELRARSSSWGSRRSSSVVGRGSSGGTTLGHARSGLSVGALDGLGSVVVGGGVAEPATTVTLLSDDGTSALAGVEATAARCTVGVRLAGTSDELGTGGCTGDVGGRGDCERTVSKINR